MDLISDIVCLNNINIDSTVLYNIKKSNLNNKAKHYNLQEFENYVNSNECKNTYIELSKCLFSNCNYNDIADSILKAYILKHYGKQLGSWYENNYDKEMNYCSSIVVEGITDIIRCDKIEKNNKFILIMDYYYSLYQIWNSKINVNNITKKMNSIIENVNTYEIMYIMDYKSVIELEKDIKKNINDLFNTYKFMALCILKDNYDKLGKFKEYFWNNVKSISDNYHSCAIILEHIRNKLLESTTDVIEKKNIYYNIDIDDLINKIKIREIKDADIHSYIKLIYSIMQLKYENKNYIDSMKFIMDKLYY